MHLYEYKEVQQLIRMALEEDIGRGDVTSGFLIPSKQKVKASIIAEESSIIAGLEIAWAVFKRLDPSVKMKVVVKDGQKAWKGKVVAQLYGRSTAILSGERVALNFLSRLSGIATLTSQFVEKVSPLQTQILDTRKTTPGWRLLEKYAVRVGGGNNHRQGLYDQVLIKDNHVAVLKRSRQSRRQFWDQLFHKIHQQDRRGLVIEAEVHSLKDLAYILANRPDWILLDNFTASQVKRAMRLRNRVAPEILVEASGGITLENIRPYAQTGVDAIAIGRLTHSARGINFSLEII